MLTPPFIMTALHLHPNVRTEADYRARQREAIAANRRLYPNLPWRTPWLSLVVPAPFISAGAWMAECPCKNCVTLAPGWGPQPDTQHVYALGLCYECGAVYEAIPMPEHMAEIERTLVRQRNLAYRYWNPRMSLGDLDAALEKPDTMLQFTLAEDHA